jgi:hypothetical protein
VKPLVVLRDLRWFNIDIAHIVCRVGKIRPEGDQSLAYDADQPVAIAFLRLAIEMRQGWPWSGAPAATFPLLAQQNAVRREYAGRSRVMIVLAPLNLSCGPIDRSSKAANISTGSRSPTPAGD